MKNSRFTCPSFFASIKFAGRRHCQRSDRWPTLHAGEPPPKPPLNCATTSNKVEDKITMPIPIKDITYIHGNPTVLWEEEEVQIMIIKEELQYAITENFSYGWSNLEKIRKLIFYGVRFKSELAIEGVIPSILQVFLISEIADVDVAELSHHRQGSRRSCLPVPDVSVISILGLFRQLLFCAMTVGSAWCAHVASMWRPCGI
ncbi:hypothetical protein MTR67_018719 [Solanum verrucosum]|uniref:Uncharacterized protein n=1 Tax=Solanum verrucosum TaxID=315347 RepID=A0AAF0QK69_SOLVR|nr:hypothetical protein MTR67_018719 [Solanum verrucosum]